MFKSIFIFFLSVFLAPLAQAIANINFDQALQKMTEGHAQVLVQKTEVNKADINVDAKLFNFLPSLSVSGSNSSSPDLGTTATNSAGANLSINLFRAGADLAALNAAKFEKSYQDYNYQNIYLQAEEESGEALINFITAKLKLQILQHSVQTYQQGLEIAKLRYAKGLLALQEVDKTTVDLDNAVARVKDAEQDCNVAEANVVRLLDKNSELEIAWPWKERLTSSNVKKMIGQEVQINERPDYKALMLNLQEQEELRKQTDRLQYPSLDFTLSQGYTGTASQSLNQSSTSVSVSIPIFGALQNTIAYKLQIQNVSASEIKLAQARRDFENLSKAAQKNMSLSLDTAFAREETLKISERLYQTNLQRLKQGRTTANDVAVDQSRLTDSELLALQGWSDAHLSFMKLCHTFGKKVLACELL